MEILLSIGVIIAIIIGILAIIAYSVATWAYVIVKTWSWFIVTAFGMAPITFVQGVAISIDLGVIAARSYSITDASLDTTSETYKKNMGYKIVGALIAPWIVLVIVWIVKLFFM